MAKTKQETASKKKKETFKCEKLHSKLHGGLQDRLVSWGIISNDPHCRFPWLVPWPMGTRKDCCPRKNSLPKVNPLETKCVYKPLFKTGQVWVWIFRGTTVPRNARAKPCSGKPCHWWNRKHGLK